MPTLKLQYMNDYVCRKQREERCAFMVKDDDTDTITVYGKYDEGHGHFSDGPVLISVADVPKNLIDEIERRSYWDMPMSAKLYEFTEDVWKIVRLSNSWFDFV